MDIKAIIEYYFHILSYRVDRDNVGKLMEHERTQKEDKGRENIEEC
jgi:hypothetical protein